MVRGNWQKRVEQAEARRKEAKQKKVVKSSKSVYKNLVQSQLWPLLDRYSLDTGEGGDNNDDDDNILQLWVDAPPLSSKGLYQNYQVGTNATTENGKELIDDPSPSTKRKSKRAGYNKNNTPNKKIHPRSHENVHSTPDEGKGKKRSNSRDIIEEESLLLCKSHFFTGNCSLVNGTKSSSKKSSLKHQQCHLFHYGRQMKTLADVSLANKDDKDGNNEMKDILKCSADAAVRSIANTSNFEDEEGHGIAPTNSISMLYHIEINLVKGGQQLNNHNRKEERESKETSISDIVAFHLSREQCPIGSIVYTFLKKHLIFDRFNGGVIIEERLQDEIFQNEQEENNRLRIGCSESGDIDTQNDLKDLPVAVLEQILEFLPDESSGILPMVCRGWNKEIGKTSPALWEFLLSRRNWAKPQLDNEGDDICIFTEECKKLFVSHKVICNAVNATIDAFSNFPSDELPLSSNSLALSKDLKENVSGCSSIRCWDTSACVVAYQKECVLSIFKAVRDPDYTLSCKKILCIRVAPFPHSRKTSCELRSFDLDKESILCCYEVNGLSNWLTLVKRESLLLNSAESTLDNDAFQKYDLCRLMQHYCVSVANGMETIIALFASRNRDLDEIEASVHGQIVACESHFNFLVNIFMPNDDEDTEIDTTVDMVQVARAIVQFSAKTESFTWCQLVPEELDPIMTDTLLSGYIPATKTLVCSSTLPSPIITIHTERRRGIMSTSIHGDMLELLSQELLTDGWELSELNQAERVAVSETHVILADALFHEENDSSKLVLSFLPIETIEYDKTSRIALKNVKYLLSMHVHGDYVTIICTIGPASNEDEFDGHWFGEEDTQNQDKSQVIIVHIPSQKEIYRRVFSDQNINVSKIKMIFGNSSLPTVFAAKDQKVLISGLVLTDVKTEILQEKPKTSLKTKVKKKKKGFKNNKKDGFARGMSMRG